MSDLVDIEHWCRERGLSRRDICAVTAAHGAAALRGLILGPEVEGQIAVCRATSPR